MKPFLILGVAYLLAAPLTDLISLDLRATEWTNIMTYIIWLASGLIWALIAFALWTALLGISYVVLSILVAIGAMFERRNQNKRVRENVRNVMKSKEQH